MISRNTIQRIIQLIFSTKISVDSVFAKVNFVIFMIFFITVSLIFYFYTDYSVDKIILPTQRFEYAKNNPEEFTQKELDDVYEINYVNIDIETIPKECTDALIAIEDRTFYENSGIDRNGIFRLYVTLIPGINIGGGSTLSQQVIKMTSDRFYGRNPIDKIKEIVWSYRLNKDFSKEKILEMYLNNAYYGDFNYGIESASLEYFGISVSKLGLDECAYLAGIPQLPNVYNPKNGVIPPAGLERKERVLKALENYNR